MRRGSDANRLFEFVERREFTLKKVLVTGANGHLGSTLVKALLLRGYSVRGSVRNPEEVMRRRIFDGMDVEVVQAELSDAVAMKAAAFGVDGVFHTAGTYKHWARDPQEEIIEPTLSGVRNALAAAKEAHVARFVYTSSVVAVGLEGSQAAPLDESHWPENSRSPYMTAKTLAEREAWRLAQKMGIDLVSICPGGIIGPNFSRHTPTTALFEDILERRVPGILPMSLDYVDVRDVAEAHILAYERREASGRYLCTNAPMTFGQVVEMVALLRENLSIRRTLIPRFILPFVAALDSLQQRVKGGQRRLMRAMIADYFQPNQLRHFDTRRIRSELGWQPRPLETSIRDTLEWIDQRASTRGDYRG